ncbi:acyltransferase [Actinoplanes sp. NPDC048796]|uniref:acyltransferase family protein n=1 Tax=Actinoplanes sp. NPDC048796 TaxID=3155640 RepID=UPI0033E6F3BA
MMETRTGVSHPAAPAAAGSTSFRPDIEGLRAVAVALVVLFHAGVPGVGGGFIGVDVFFVISGFLITSLMLRELAETGRISLVGFYARRCRRLLPAAGLVLVTVVLAGYHRLGFLRGDEIAEDATWAALFASNFRFASRGVDYLASQSAPSPVQHFWSLAVEEQFYLVWPVALVLLLWLGFRWALPYWLVGAAVLSLAYSIGQSGPWAFFSPVTRLWELAAGCLLGLAAPRLRHIPYRIAGSMAAVGVALIVIAALTFDERTAFPGYAAVLPVGATVLVLAGRGDALLGGRPMMFLGRLSYSLYLWHWPVLIIAEQAAGEPLPARTRAVLVLLSVALAVVTYFCVEDPIRRSRRLKRSHLLSLALALLLVAAPLAVAGWKTSTSPAADTGRGDEYQPRLGAPAPHVQD